NSTVSIVLTYPSSIPYGDYVRIRLITDIDERYTDATTINSACTTSLFRGQSEDYAIYVKPVTWTGATDTDWANAGNWNTGVVPTASENTSIPSGGNQPVINSAVSVKSFVIENGGTLTINAEKSLDITGNLTNNGTLTINNGGALKVSGTSTGNITYNLNIADTNWYLVSSPVIGQQYD
ncbi:MAG: hypothetical protein ACPGTO_12040, partial [Polaribacter sp.]